MAISTLSAIFPDTFNDGLSLFSLPWCGCAPPPFQRLGIKLKRAVPCGISMSGFKLDVTLEITNPYMTTLRTTGFSYKIAEKLSGDIDEDDGFVVVLAEGSMEDGIEIAGDGTREVVISCSYGGLGSLGKCLLMGHALDFVMSGEAQYKIPMTETACTIPYQVEGQLATTTSSKTEATEGDTNWNTPNEQV